MLNAAPSGPKSWCRHTPCSFTCLPFRKKPPFGVNSAVRSPTFCVTLSSGCPPRLMVTVSVSRLGESMSHAISGAFAISNSPQPPCQSVLPSGAARTAVTSPAPTVSAESAQRHISPRFSAWKYTPSVAKWSAGVLIRYMSRKMPAPEYQRVFGASCRTSISSSFSPACRCGVTSISNEE